MCETIVTIFEVFEYNKLIPLSLFNVLLHGRRAEETLIKSTPRSQKGESLSLIVT